MSKRAEYLGPERRRPLVLDAAEEIFAEGGFANASMSAIAARAGVSKAVLYDCFPGGKSEIYVSLLDRTFDVFLAHMVEALDRANELPIEDGLRLGLTAFMDYAEINPRGFHVLFAGPGTGDKQITRRAFEVKQKIIERMSQRTKRIVEAAGIPMTPAIEVYNRSIAAIARELGLWILEDPKLPKAELIEAIVRWLMLGFERIVPDGVAQTT
ncbi:MAG TPA: TetR/AcrR family transcriptional regulator [Actinomycetota bacterium]